MEFGPTHDYGEKSSWREMERESVFKTRETLGSYDTSSWINVQQIILKSSGIEILNLRIISHK